METRILDAAAVKESADLAAIIPAVEAAFAADGRGNTVMPAKSYIDLPQYNGDFRSMPAYVNATEWDAAALKWVNVHPDNPSAHELPTVMGTLIYSDPATAVPLAIMDATGLTGLRTGAAAAIATDYLAVEDAASLGIVGAGAQASRQLEAINRVRDLRTVRIADRNQEKQTRFVAEFGDRFDINPASIREAAQCDILSTVTPVETPIVTPEMVGDHTHINAIGADAPGKNELATQIQQSAKLVIDNFEQCTHSGEINVPWAAGDLTAEDIHAELGDVVLGQKSGREPTDEITVFDSTGLAIQDVAAAHTVYESAKQADTGITLHSFLED